MTKEEAEAIKGKLDAVKADIDKAVSDTENDKKAEEKK